MLHFAKTDMVNKNASLKAVAAQLPTLIEVVEADKKAGKATVKASVMLNPLCTQSFEPIQPACPLLSYAVKLCSNTKLVALMPACPCIPCTPAGLVRP